MQKINPKEGTLPPSCCIICEMSFQGEAVDTGHNLDTGGYSYLQGRKYVCDLCVDQIAKLFGYEKGTEVADARNAREIADRQVAAIRGLVTDFSAFMAKFVNSEAAINDEVAVEFKSANAPKVVETQAEATEVAPEADAKKDGTETKTKAPKPKDKTKEVPESKDG